MDSALPELKEGSWQVYLFLEGEQSPFDLFANKFGRPAVTASWREKKSPPCAIPQGVQYRKLQLKPFDKYLYIR